MEEETKKEKTLLEKLYDRRARAEMMSEEFRNRPSLFEEFQKVLKAEMFLRGLQIALKAPHTMNPQKIRDHYKMVRDYIREFSGEEIPDADAFFSQLVISNVNSYDKALTAWVFGNLKNTAKLIDLANNK